MPEVDCADRFPLCRAVCCSLEVRLTDEEHASGRYQTQPLRPRFLRRADEGDRKSVV